MARRSPITLFLVLFLLCAPSVRPAAAGAVIPDTPAGRRAAAFVEAMKSGTEAGARQFLEANYTPQALAARPVEARLDAYRGLMEDMADPQVLEVREVEGTLVLIILGRSGGGAFQVRFDTDPAADHRLRGVLVQPTIAGAPPVPPGPLTDEQRAGLLHQLCDSLQIHDRFSGVIMVARNGRPFFQRAVGDANKAFEIGNRVDTRFCLGSMNKMFTAVAVARLAEQGKLSFDDLVGRHLPDLENEELKSKVRIRHLLTHTSGLGSYFESPYYEANWTRMRTVADYRPVVESEKLAFEPGAGNRYSNTGFVVLGMIIEKLSGQDYYDYVRDNIFLPVGMNASDSFENDAIVPNLAVGYTRMEGHLRPGGALRTNVYQHSARGTPAGGGYSNAPDLLRFGEALRSHRLLGPAMTDTVITAKVSLGGPGAGYGFGFGDFRDGEWRYVGHNGGAPGMSTEFRTYLSPQPLTLIVLSNYDRVAGMVAEYVDQLLRK